MVRTQNHAQRTNHSSSAFKSIPILIGALLFFSSISDSSSATNLGKKGIIINKVTVSGPRRIAKGQTKTYTINFIGKRIIEGRVNPATKNVTFPAVLRDKDGRFRGHADLLSKRTISVGKGTSAEKNAEIYVSVNSIDSKVKKLAVNKNL